MDESPDPLKMTSVLEQRIIDLIRKGFRDQGVDFRSAHLIDLISEEFQDSHIIPEVKRFYPLATYLDPSSNFYFVSAGMIWISFFPALDQGFWFVYREPHRLIVLDDNIINVVPIKCDYQEIFLWFTDLEEKIEEYNNIGSDLLKCNPFI